MYNGSCRKSAMEAGRGEGAACGRLDVGPKREDALAVFDCAGPETAPIGKLIRRLHCD